MKMPMETILSTEIIEEPSTTTEAVTIPTGEIGEELITTSEVIPTHTEEIFEELTKTENNNDIYETVITEVFSEEAVEPSTKAPATAGIVTPSSSTLLVDIVTHNTPNYDNKIIFHSEELAAVSSP